MVVPVVHCVSGGIRHAHVAYFPAVYLKYVSYQNVWLGWNTYNWYIQSWTALNFALHTQETEMVRPAAHSANSTGTVRTRRKTMYRKRTFD